MKASGFTHLLLILLFSAAAGAAAFFNAGTGQEERIVHPNGYSGTGGVIPVTVCVDPASPFAQESSAPLRRAIETWNALTPQNENINPAPSVPADRLDLESTVLHELGHCLGLGHPNLTLFGLFISDFTNAGLGPNGVENIDNGDDDILGSSDDLRGDDINVNWFRKSDNPPFLLSDPVDSTTYSRDISDLPVGDNQKYSANANDGVARNVFSLFDTEAVMHSEQNNGVEHRKLAFDDVAALRYGMGCGSFETVTSQ